MIWFTLALFVVSFLVTALLAPKPEIENARAESFDNLNFPRATEDAPIPLVLGRVRFKAPNTLWYGDFRSEAIRERIKTGLFSKKTITVGYKYYLGIDLGLCMGPNVQLHEIIIDDKSVWTGSTSTTTSTGGSVSALELFGGHKNGGGFSGSWVYYPGAFDQTVNAYLQGQVGAANVPAYNGLAHIVFQGAYIGESAQLRTMAFVLSSYSNAINVDNSGRVGDDMNPMEAIYQVMTDQWRGLGVPASMIDVPNFRAAGNVLLAEGNGVSILVSSQQSGKQIISEILRQIDGVMYQDPETGLFKIKLIRFDYNPDTVPEYDEFDVIQIRNFSKTAWEDVISQVKVSFSQRDKDSTAVAISMDSATAAMFGRLRTTNVSFPFCYSATLANALASRERAALSVPLFRATIELNRNGYSLRPGDVFKLNWPEYGLVGAIFRVQRHDLGALLDNRIVVDCLQDSFAQADTIFAPPAASTWQPITTIPQAINVFSVVEMPYFIGSRLEFPIADGRAAVIPLALKPGLSSTGFDFLLGIASGNLPIREPEQADYPATGTLSAIYPATAGVATGLDATGFTLINTLGTFEVPTAGEQRSGDAGLLWVDGEWMSYGGVGVGGVLTNIRRGLFGTTPKTHAAGTRVWNATPELFGLGTIGDDLSETGTVFFKMLDRIGGTSLDESNAIQYSATMQDLADRPLRPRNVQLAGSRAFNLVTATNQTVTWVASNRAAAEVTYENDAAQTPDQTETYDVRVWFDGVLQGGLSLNGVSSGATINFSSLSGPLTVANAEIRVFSRRTGGDLKSSAYHAFVPFTVNIP